MTQTTTTCNAAWGLELSHTGAYLVRWELASAGASAQHRRTFPIGGFWQTGVLDADLLGALGQIPQAEPLGVCFPDQAMLCRGFALPRAQANVMEKMVHAQMEALLSAGPERLTSNWQAFPDPLNAGMQWVLFCAARREVLDRLNAAIPAGIALRAVLPRALATAHSWPRGASATPSHLLLELTHEAATMSLVADGHLLRCTVLGVDHAPEAEPSGSSGAQSWVRQSRQSYHSLLEGLPRERWPRQGLIRGSNGEAAGFLPTLADALGVDLHPWSSPPDAATNETTSPYLGAEGIARLVLDDPAALHINFARPAKPPGSSRSHPSPPSGGSGTGISGGSGAALRHRLLSQFLAERAGRASPRCRNEFRRNRTTSGDRSISGEERVAGAAGPGCNSCRCAAFLEHDQLQLDRQWPVSVCRSTWQSRRSG